MVSIIQLLALLFSLNGPAAKAYLEVELQPESRIWIEGRSNVGKFICDATEKEGYALIATQVEGNGSAQDAGRAEVRIPVECFECGNARMDRDLYEALKGADHPAIIFELVEATSTPGNGKVSGKRIEGIGLLTVAGTTREIAFTADGTTLSNDRMRATGKVMIRMTDFDIEPPIGLMGLVKAQDGLTVNFDLVAKPVRSLRSNHRP